MAMNEEWMNWTHHNLSRGCDPQGIVDILRNNGFSERDIKFAMEQYKPGKGQPNIVRVDTDRDENGIRKNFDYLKMANPPMLDQLERLGGYQVDDDRLQLYVIPKFLTDPECDSLIDVVNQNLRPSTVTSGRDDYGFRTSSTCDLYSDKSAAAKMLDKKISKTLGVKLSWSETNQGQKYLVGQEFKAHTDYFTPNSKEFEKFGNEMGQRTWTFTVYLNETPKGGATYFTKIDKPFYPKKGQATIWNNLNKDGTINPWTEHHGMPVEDGEKIIVTKWFRDKGKGKSPFIE